MHAVQGMRCCHGRLAPTVPGQASRFSPVLGSATLCQPKRRPCRRFSPCKLACTQSGHDRAFNVAPICREGGFVHAGCADAWEEGGERSRRCPRSFVPSMPRSQPRSSHASAPLILPRCRHNPERSEMHGRPCYSPFGSSSCPARLPGRCCSQLGCPTPPFGSGRAHEKLGRSLKLTIASHLCEAPHCRACASFGGIRPFFPGHPWIRSVGSLD